MSKRCVAFLLVAGLFALSGGGHAQDASSKNKRTFYVVKHADAKELANVLAKHFKGDAEIQLLPDSPSNCLLINAAPNVFEEVVKLLEQLDKRPQLVSVELIIAEVTPKKEKDEKAAAKELDLKEYTGASKDVVKKLETLQKDGVLSGLKRFQLTAIENQAASVRTGEVKPIVTAVNTTGRGTVSRVITYRDTGTNIRITPRVDAENGITLNLEVQDARLHVPEDGIELGKDENGTPVRATEIILAKLDAKISVRSEQAIAAEGVTTDSKSGKAQTLIIVSARILESGAKSSK
jgi:hypothetical protein